MSEEIKIEEEKKCNCFCQSKGFRKFLTIALGTFVGVYAALSLFTAIHKPPIMPIGYGAPYVHPCQCGCHHFRGHHADRGYRGEFHKKMMKEQSERKLPPRAEEIDD